MSHEVTLLIQLVFSEESCKRNVADCLLTLCFKCIFNYSHTDDIFVTQEYENCIIHNERIRELIIKSNKFKLHENYI